MNASLMIREFRGIGPIRGVEMGRDYGDAAKRRSSFALRATEDKYDRGDQATRRSDGRWCLKGAAVWYNFIMSGKE